MKFLCEKRHLWSRLPSCDQCFTTCEKRRKKTVILVFSLWKCISVINHKFKQLNTCSMQRKRLLTSLFAVFTLDLKHMSFLYKFCIKLLLWFESCRLEAVTWSEGSLRLNCACWTLTFRMVASPPQTCKQIQWPGNTQQLSSRPDTNVLTEFLGISGLGWGVWRGREIYNQKQLKQGELLNPKWWMREVICGVFTAQLRGFAEQFLFTVFAGFRGFCVLGIWHHCRSPGALCDPLVSYQDINPISKTLTAADLIESVQVKATHLLIACEKEELSRVQLHPVNHTLF